MQSFVSQQGSADADASSSTISTSGSGDLSHVLQALPRIPSMPGPCAASRGFKEHGCSHYRRRCKLLAPCCGEFVWCRHCHNAAKSDNEQDPKKRHVLDRSAVKEVMCAVSYCAPVCSQWGAIARHVVYHLACTPASNATSLMTTSPSSSSSEFMLLLTCMRSCDKCGICRVGGRENYFHCDTCNCCYAMLLRSTHRCIENSMHHNCPVCFEYLFDSVKPISVMPCGHTIHQDCLRSLADHRSYVCPMCSKCYMNGDSKQQLWDKMDQEVRETLMPEEYRNYQVNILCNDCGNRNTTLFHVVGLKCSGCGGYNTRRL
ncbi:hypothetical protein QJQ45_021953 [Haematococcus lacustris]|nr:hypothetical protein QJQ45_015046 [Haematococcus lacustris]KAJ9531802.1 hypothetical protein QJQ45_021953 [Haematococcus lacustris]